MSASICAIGDAIATQPRPTSQPCVISPHPPSTVRDVLNAVDPTNKSAPMMWTTANHLSEFANLSIDKLPLEFLLDVSPSFGLYLKERRYSVNSVRTYCQHARRLLAKARELGWSPDNDLIAEEWGPLLSALGGVPGTTKGIIRFAIRKGRRPSDLSESDISEWGDCMERRGRRHMTVRCLKGRFRRAVVQAGIEHLLPKVSFDSHPSDYGIPISDMPEPLRSEVLAILKWKQDRFAKGRPQRGKHRAVSARQLEAWFRRLYGFAYKVDHRDQIHTLLDLVSEDVITSFVSWALNVRNLSRNSMLKLSLIYAAIRYHPSYKDQNFQWFSAIFTQLPDDQESTLIQRKAVKYLPYDALCMVPESIKAKRSQKGCDAKRASVLVHDELLITWLTTLPWRQRNLRECRLGDPSTANVFLAEIPSMVHIAKPSWVEDALKLNPNERFWQFHFRELETKTGHAVRGILPRRLVPSLEEYIQDHRPHLVAGVETDTIFLNRAGVCLKAQDLTELVSQVIFDHAGKRVNPHLCRDIFAYKWLEDHPEDYLTLSKILWHQDIKTTLRIYGRNFDESNGARRIDEWLTARSSGS